jgi:hypothetical protein
MARLTPAGSPMPRSASVTSLPVVYLGSVLGIGPVLSAVAVPSAAERVAEQVSGRRPAHRPCRNLRAGRRGLGLRFGHRGWRGIGSRAVYGVGTPPRRGERPVEPGQVAGRPALNLAREKLDSGRGALNLAREKLDSGRGAEPPSVVAERISAGHHWPTPASGHNARPATGACPVAA